MKILIEGFEENYNSTKILLDKTNKKSHRKFI